MLSEHSSRLKAGNFDYGPNSAEVNRILRRASAMTRDEMRLLSGSSAWSRTRGVPLAYAHIAVRVAAKAAAREDQFTAAFQAAWRAPYGASGSATRCAVRDAATAAVVSDLVGRHGLTQAHIDILMAPWVQELGSDWMDGGKVSVTDIFGPNTAAVELVISRAAALTAEEIDKFDRLNKATGAGEKREHDRENSSWSVSNAALLAGREEESGGALQEAGDAAKAAVETAKRSMWSAAWSATLDAATAAVVADLVGQHGLTQQHIDTLMGPWVTVLGSDWDKEPKR